LSARIKDTKEKILFWLKEESLSPEEVVDPNAYFNIGIKSGDLRLNVVQATRHIDSFFIGTRWSLSKEQVDLHKSKMDESKRIAFFQDLQSMLLSESQLGDYEFQNGLNDFQSLFVTSKRIFYDSLTKQALIDAIVTVHKAVMRSVFLLQRYTGALPPDMTAEKGSNKA
jgi:hypothetical protein